MKSEARNTKFETNSKFQTWPSGGGRGALLRFICLLVFAAVGFLVTYGLTKFQWSSKPGEAPPGMVWIPGGEFLMGCEDPRSCLCGGPDAMNDARPIHRVYVDGFWMDKTEVTNEQFAKFVEVANYVTIAERTPRAEDFPNAPAGKSRRGVHRVHSHSWPRASQQSLSTTRWPRPAKQLEIPKVPRALLIPPSRKNASESTGVDPSSAPTSTARATWSAPEEEGMSTPPAIISASAA